MQTGQSQKNSPPDSSMTQQDCLTFLKSSKVGKEGEPRVFSLCLARSMSGPVRVLLLDSTIQIWSTWRGGEHDPSIVNFPFGSTFKIWALPILWDFHHWYLHRKKFKYVFCVVTHLQMKVSSIYIQKTNLQFLI